MATMTKANPRNSIIENELKKSIRGIPDFPKKGILFYDITTLLQNPQAFRKAVDALARRFKDKKIDTVVAIESRGFIFGGALAYKLGAGFVPVRKKGKLPFKTKSASYSLEYGTDTLEMHIDAISSNKKVLIVDDLLATGGTAAAVTKLVKSFNAKIIGVAFLIDLTFLNGREKLKDVPVSAIIKY